MHWDFTLHPDEQADQSSDSDTSWPTTPAPKPTSYWAIGPPPRDDTGRWLVGLRFAIQDNYAILIEQRTFLAEDDLDVLIRVGWSGNLDTIPRNGLTASVVKNLALFDMEDQVRVALRDPKDSAWGDEPFSVYDDGEPSENLANWQSIIEATGLDTTDQSSKLKRGRRPVDPVLLAHVAWDYTEARRQGEKVHRFIESAMRRRIDKRIDAGQWIKKARDRGFLTPTEKTGQLGGKITKKAIDILKETGYLNSNGERTSDQKGATE